MTLVESTCGFHAIRVVEHSVAIPWATWNLNSQDMRAFSMDAPCSVLGDQATHRHAMSRDVVVSVPDTKTRCNRGGKKGYRGPLGRVETRPKRGVPFDRNSILSPGRTELPGPTRAATLPLINISSGSVDFSTSEFPFSTSVGDPIAGELRFRGRSFAFPFLLSPPPPSKEIS